MKRWGKTLLSPSNLSIYIEVIMNEETFEKAQALKSILENLRLLQTSLANSGIKELRIIDTNEGVHYYQPKNPDKILKTVESDIKAYEKEFEAL